MQSSPPGRTSLRSPSPEQSEYSLDLDALDLDAQSDGSDPLPRKHVDRVFSEAIDGPSDFTQNMEMWIRGGPVASKGTQPVASFTQHSTQEGDANGKEPQEEGQLAQHTKPDAVDTMVHNFEDGDVSSRAALNNNVAKVPIVEEPEQNDEQFSSEWYPNGQSSTPAPSKTLHLLQPTVEDYHSELTTGNQLLAAIHYRGSETLPPRDTQSMLDRATNRSAAQSSPSSPAPTDMPPKSAQPAPYPISPQPGVRSEDGLRLEWVQMQAKCDELARSNASLSRALEDERCKCENEAKFHDANIARVLQRERDLAVAKDTACKDRENVQLELEEVAAQLNDLRQLNTQAGQPMTDDDNELSPTSGNAQRLGHEYQQALQSLKQELESAQQKHQTSVEELAEQHRDDLQEQRELHEYDLERLRLELQQARNDEMAIAELERQLETANNDIARLKSTNSSSEGMIRTLRSELETTRESHSDQLTRTTSDHIRAVELAADLQRQVQQLRQQLRETEASTSDPTQTSPKLPMADNDSSETVEQVREQLSTATLALEAKQSEVNLATIERDAAQDSAQAAEADADALRAQLADLEAVNAALDARVSESMRRREGVWRDKLHAAEHERDLLAKALMHQWGRNEVGLRQPQSYAYRYPDSRSSATAESAKIKARAKGES